MAENDKIHQENAIIRNEEFSSEKALNQTSIPVNEKNKPKELDIFSTEEIITKKLVGNQWEEGIFDCQFWKESFSWGSNLEDHIDSEHTVKLPHKCKSCDTGFSNRSDLNRHMGLVHEGKKPYQCEKCNDSFNYKRSLNRHFYRVHEGKKPYLCNKCNESFNEKRNLNRHTSSVHMKKTRNTFKSISSAPSKNNPKTTNNSLAKIILRKIKGTPFKAHGTPFKTQGTPYKAQGIPFKTQSAPIKTHGAQFKTQGTPCKTQGIPFKTDGAPIKTHGTPFKAHGIPFKAQITPLGIQDGPGIPFNCHTCGSKFTSTLILEKHISVIHQTE